MPELTARFCPSGAHAWPDRTDLGGARSCIALVPTMPPLFAFISAWACPIGATAGKHSPLLGPLFHMPTNGGGLPKLCPSGKVEIAQTKPNCDQLGIVDWDGTSNTGRT